MQKGSLNLLRKKWESSDYQKSECCPGGSRCRLFQPQESKLFEYGQVIPSPEPPDLPSHISKVKEDLLTSELEENSPGDKRGTPREYGQPEVLKEDLISGRHRIERFSIALDELRSVFENPRSGKRLTGPAEYSQKVRNNSLKVEVHS